MSSLTGVLAIVRLRDRAPVDEVLDALVRGGLTQVEVTLPTPGSLATIERWSRRTEVAVGAGTVRTADGARRAIDAGAQFLVTPTVSQDVLDLAARRGVPVACGAATPSEIDLAARLGAAAVKVFPARLLGGPAYIRAIREPLDDVALMATGGVTAADVGDYRRSGCIGVGVGSPLVSEELVAGQDWAALEARAAEFVRAWSEGPLDG